MNGPLDRLVDNLTCNFCNTKCKHYMKCKDCKKCKTCDEIESCEICKACTKLSDCCKDCNKIYEHCGCFLKYMEVTKKHFIFVREKCEIKIAILP